MPARHSDDRNEAMAGTSDASRAWVTLLRDFGARVDRAVEAHANGDSGKVMRAWRGFDKVGDYPVMVEAVHRRLSARGIATDLIDDERSPHLASVPDSQLAGLASKMRDARSSRSPDERDFSRNQRVYVTREDLADALATKPGSVGPSPVGTLLARLGGDVAFHVPGRLARDGREAEGPVTYRGQEALERLHAGFGKGALRTLDVPLNPVFAISQRGYVNAFNPSPEDRAVVKGTEELVSRTVGIVTRDHLAAPGVSRAPRPRGQSGQSR